MPDAGCLPGQRRATRGRGGDHRRLSEGPGPRRRDAAQGLAWLLQTLLDRFGLADDPAAARGIAMMRAGVLLDQTARQQINAVRDRLGYDGPLTTRWSPIRRGACPRSAGP